MYALPKGLFGESCVQTSCAAWFAGTAVIFRGQCIFLVRSTARSKLGKLYEVPLLMHVDR